MKNLRAERGSAILRRIDRWLGIPLVLPAALYRKVTAPRPAVIQKIGIISLGAIGDLLLLSALTDGIRKAAPECSIELIASAANAAALPLNPHADSFFSAPVREIFKILAHIRKQKFDVLIDASQWARVGNLLCNFSGAGRTAGFSTPGQFRSAGYDAICFHSDKQHEVENFLGLGRAIWPELEGMPGLRLPQPESRDNAVYCHLWAAPGKGREFRQWPEEYWAQLIRQLLAEGKEVYLTGSAADAPECLVFLSRYFAGEKRLISIAGKASLVELGMRFSRCCGVISVNTGIMHLAALAGPPVVALHGATNPMRWGPVSKNAISLLPRTGDCAYLNLGFEQPANVRPAMRNLPVCDALEALRKLNVI